jgi:hypothetical protein
MISRRALKNVSTRPFTKKDFERYMRRQWLEKDFKLAKAERVGIAIHELVKHSQKRNSKTRTPYLDLWIAILDEFVSWFISLATIFYGERKVRKHTNFERSVTLILMKIIADSIAMRHLILLGYDVAAQALLRSIGEYAELLVAILDDPPLADEFVKSDIPKGAKIFWNSHIARGSLQKRVIRAWQNWFQGVETEAAAWFANWGRQSNIKLSAMLHPSFAAGLFSAVTFKTKHTGEKWLGIWGDRSDGSVKTIYMYASYVFPIFLLHDNFPFEGFDTHLHAPIKFNKAKELHRHVKEGRHILASLILSAGKRSNQKHIFPNYDMSIYRRRRRRISSHNA